MVSSQGSGYEGARYEGAGFEGIRYVVAESQKVISILGPQPTQWAEAAKIPALGSLIDSSARSHQELVHSCEGLAGTVADQVERIADLGGVLVVTLRAVHDQILRGDQAGVGELSASWPSGDGA